MGDKVLRTTGKVLTANCRRSDVAGRFGGDEFLLLLPHTSPDVAEQVARRIQHHFHAAVRSLTGEALECNMSIGMACISLNTPTSADQLVALADAALYRAKQSGKARLHVSGTQQTAAMDPDPGAAPAIENSAQI